MGALLAGGQGRRFGSPKGLALVAGTRLVDRAAGTLRELCSEVLLVANDPDAARWLPGTTLLPDVIPGGGALSGIHAALLHAQEPVVVLAWDMPFASAALLRELARRIAAGHVDAAVPESDSPVGMEPVCACYAPSCLPALEAAIASGRTGAAQFVRALPNANIVPRAEVARFGEPARIFFGVNTPDDLRRAEAMAAGAL